jgi:hypothetical protein
LKNFFSRTYDSKIYLESSVRGNMPRRNRDQNMLMLIGVVVLVLIAVTLYRKYYSGKYAPQPQPQHPGEHHHPVGGSGGKYAPQPEPQREHYEYELVPGDYEPYDNLDSIGYEAVGGPDENFQVGVGAGPGLYGSGRHTSEMIGN